MLDACEACIAQQILVDWASWSAGSGCVRLDLDAECLCPDATPKMRRSCRRVQPQVRHQGREAMLGSYGG